MERLLTAGLVYLIVVAIVLAIKPSFMFTDDGTWKEFGIGRNPATHTWMPFWLFAVLWALISYILTTIGFALLGKKTAPLVEPATAAVNKSAKSSPEVAVPLDSILDNEDEIATAVTNSTKNYKARTRGRPMTLPDGYYVLNSDATEAAGGVPKYVYIGKGLPEDS